MFIRYGVRTNTTIVVSVGVSMVTVSHMERTQFVFPSCGETHRILTDHRNRKLAKNRSQPNLLDHGKHPALQSAQKDGNFGMMLNGCFCQLHKLFGTGVTPIQNSHPRMIPNECHLGIQGIGVHRQHTL